MRFSIERAAVIGAGVMGANLAAHLANAGIRTLLLDIVPPDGKGPNADPSSRGYRDEFALAGLKRSLTASPRSFYVDDAARLITTGNIQDDLEALRGVDWVLEAVTEKLDIKEAVFKTIAPYLNEHAILTSNTSGLSAEAMAAVLDDRLRPRFLVTHFFNPPRYMHLLELVPHPGTDPICLENLTAFAQSILGKGVVIAKDTPNFIANRIGAFSIAAVFKAMIEGDFTVEEVDRLTGPLIGRPKSATLRTADLVGLDTLAHTCKTVYDRAEGDSFREYFKMPAVVDKMIAAGMLGEKSGGGFYKKTKKDGATEILSLDLATMTYRERMRPKFASLDLVKTIDDPAERIRMILAAKDRAADFLWRSLSDVMVYAADRLSEIADDVTQVDQAMRWGYNWELGPFQLWDALGVERVAKRLQKEGRDVPQVVQRVLESESKSFYYRTPTESFYFTSVGEHAASPAVEEEIDLTVLKRDTTKVIKKNAGASLVDMGDGVLCVEFHSKMNSIGGDSIAMIHHGIKEVEANYEALVIGNHGANFSVGANIMLLLFEAQEGNWEEIDLMVRTFQKATSALKYCKRPIVAAPFGLALGGGCEIVLGAGHVMASAETYIGLVELGVGLIPAGGGSKEFLMRQLEGAPRVDGVDLFPYVRAAFETVGMAKVATSAEEARQLRFLRRADGVCLNPRRLLHAAKQMALGLARQGYRAPDPTVQIPVVGESGLGAIKTHLYILQEGKFISEYDAYLAGELARVLCGGRVLSGTLVTEQHLLDLEREVFLRLCGQRKTIERIQHMLKKGKPLRN